MVICFLLYLVLKWVWSWIIDSLKTFSYGYCIPPPPPPLPLSTQIECTKKNLFTIFLLLYRRTYFLSITESLLIVSDHGPDQLRLHIRHFLLLSGYWVQYFQLSCPSGYFLKTVTTTFSWLNLKIAHFNHGSSPFMLLTKCEVKMKFSFIKLTLILEAYFKNQCYAPKLSKATYWNYPLPRLWSASSLPCETEHV